VSAPRFPVCSRCWIIHNGLAGNRQWSGLGKLGDESVMAALPAAAGSRRLDAPARQRAADALSKIGGDAALAALWDEFKHRRFQRIGYISSALALFTPESSPGCARRPRATTRTSDTWPPSRSARDDRAVPALERLMAEDRGATVFDGQVSVAARKRLRTLRRIQAAVASRSVVASLTGNR
jgi:hypothetical protein